MYWKSSEGIKELLYWLYYLTYLESIKQQSFLVNGGFVAGQVIFQTTSGQVFHNKLYVHSSWVTHIANNKCVYITLVYCKKCVCLNYRLTLFVADAFVFDNVLMVKVSNGVDLSPQIAALAFWFQRFDGDQLTRLISIRIVQTQLHHSKVTLHKKGRLKRRMLYGTHCLFIGWPVRYLSKFSDFPEESPLEICGVCLLWRNYSR